MPNKYFYNMPVELVRQIRMIGLAKSKSKTDETKIKNWITKTSGASNPKQFTEGGLTDSYLTRILHKVLPWASKSKFLKPGQTTSRLYTYDGEPSIENKMVGGNLKDKVMGLSLHALDVNKIADLKGLLKSLVFCVITGKADTKLENFGCYPTDKETESLVAAIDFEPALNTTVFASKNWSAREVKSLVDGTGTASKNISVAEALTETLAHFSTRAVTGFRVMARLYGIHKRYDALKPFYVKYLEKELSAINPDHHLALLQVFREVLDVTKAEEAAAYTKTCTDSRVKFADSAEDLAILEKHMPKMQKALRANLSKFEKIISGLEKKYSSGVSAIASTAGESGVTLVSSPISKSADRKSDREIPAVTTEGVWCNKIKTEVRERGGVS